jgi:hypothetical protein
MATFNRQESRLERTFYKALHELQRLRQLKLASLSQPQSVGRVPDRPSKKINNIQTAPPDPNPIDDPETAIHLVPPASDMQ